ncbi:MULTISPECIES: serine hydrolase domain-containing protein [unclassified Streptomyces]|uniref:serine hydrolase domain-containing protein n=1 Tax=unclassified Streptomyces TaxID=2593676 RepID=UPI002E30A0FE|nr:MULTISPECIES: serine hydrolase domain-containing protein [unclassified Streptomyces]WUC65892.1 beta-lactamase family protein [Streptomyces sp. NBC_00539]
MTKRWRGAAVGAAAVGLVAVPLGVSAGYGWDMSATPASVARTAVQPSATVTQPSPSASDEFAQLTPAVVRQLDAAIQKVMKDAQVPGVIVSLSAPGKGTYERAFGVADKANGAPMTPDLNMRIGSETKTFTVTALLKLVDAGKVGLDDPIGTYVSGVPNGDRITLRQLAGMRSGLFNYSEDPGFFKALTSNPRRPFTPRELLAFAFKHPVMFAPGAKFSYCNTNLILLGLVVEKVSGDKLADYIQHNVIEPAGLHHTLFPTGSEFPKPHAQGYTNQTASGKTEDAADWNPSWGWAAGAMISDREDLRTWARVVATGTLLTPQTQAQRLKVLNADNIPDSGYGLGIFNVEGWIGHNGSLPGYESLTVYLPGPQATLVVLLNTDITYQGSEPSTLFGQAITKTVTPKHVFDLPAQPVTGH